jgi:hypothetical protein
MNLQDIQERHSKSHATASPTESEYRRYSNNAGLAYNEAIMVYQTGGKLLKEEDDERVITIPSINHSQAFQRTLGSMTVCRPHNPILWKGSGEKNTIRSRSISMSAEQFYTTIILLVIFMLYDNND